MTLSSPKRCHARPTTKASNCRAVSCSVAAGSCPGEGSSLTKRPACRPRVAHHTEAIVHEQLDARGAQVREKAARVCARRADCVDNDVEQSAGPGAHVLRLTPQPQCVDADQRAGSSARAQRARTGGTPTKIRLVVTDFKSGLRELRPAPDIDKGAPEGRPAFLTPCKHRIRVRPTQAGRSTETFATGAMACLNPRKCSALSAAAARVAAPDVPVVATLRPA
jgi:hypothetical protein